MAFHFLCLAFPALAAANSWSIMEDWEGRRLQALPDGFEINETLNGSIPLTVLPSWDTFLQFSDKNKYVKGRLSITTIFPEEEATKFVSDPENMVDVVNFGSGSGDINRMSAIRLFSPKTGEVSTSISKNYVGEFSQSAFPYDMSCYPFDRKKMRFQIALQNPSGMFYRLVLGCAGESLTGEGANTTRVDPDGTLRECSWPINRTFVGFEWQSFDCTLTNNATIDCQMVGIRNSGPLLKNYMWPSIIYGLMGFLAFALGVKLSMPRVATTMLALLSLTNLRNQVIALLPNSEDASWLEEYFLIAISFMFLNLIGHAASFHLDSIGRQHTQKIVNKFNLWGMLAVFVAVVIARLHLRHCEEVDPIISLTMTLVAAGLSISTILFLVCYHREAGSSQSKLWG